MRSRSEKILSQKERKFVKCAAPKIISPTWLFGLSVGVVKVCGFYLKY
jgi:hypothetical protein